MACSSRLFASYCSPFLGSSGGSGGRGYLWIHSSYTSKSGLFGLVGLGLGVGLGRGRDL